MPGRVLSHSQLLWFAPPWNSERPESVETAGNLEVGDAPAVLYPLQQEVKDRLPDPALWNPYIQGGRPLLADAQAAPLSPFSLPSYLLPFYTSLAFVAALKLFTAAFGMFLLGRALGMRHGGALLAGAAYGLNLWLVTWLVYPHASVWALIPLLLFATETLVRRPDLLSGAAVAAVSAAVLLSGHPESAFHAFFVAGLFWLLRVIGAWRAGDAGFGRRLGFFAGALALGGLVSAAMTLPFLELVLRSADITEREGTAELHVIDKRFLLGFALYDYWGRGTGTSIELFLLARANYIGALPLMLAAAALVVRPNALRITLAVFAAACLAVAYKVPVVWDLVTFFPPFSSGHNNRLPLLALLAIALLAGFGLRRAVGPLADARPAGDRDRRGDAGGPGAVGRGRRDVVARRARPRAARWPGCSRIRRRRARQGFADAIRMASLLVWVRHGGRRPRPAGAAGARRGSAAGCSWRWPWGSSAPTSSAPAWATTRRSTPTWPQPPATGAMRYLRVARGRRASSPYTAATPVPQNVIPMQHRLYEARGYDLPTDLRYDRLWRRAVSPEFPSQVGPFASYIPLSVPRLGRRAATHAQPARRRGRVAAALRAAAPNARASVWRTRGRTPASTPTRTCCRGPSWSTASASSKTRTRRSTPWSRPVSARARRRSSRSASRASRPVARGNRAAAPGSPATSRRRST